MYDTCIVCGMPLENPEDLGADLFDGPACKHCVNENGKLKSCQEIFEGGVKFFMGAIPEIKKDFAEKITRKNMNQLPCWKAHPCDCLKGEEATDEEFQEILKKIS